MMDLVWIRVLLLCFLAWLSASLSESRTVEVKPGDSTTFSCTNVSSEKTLALWMRAVHTSQPVIISSVYGTEGKNEKSMEGFKARFAMKYNSLHFNLTLLQVDVSDSGWYYCMFYRGTSWEIVNSTFLKIHGNEAVCEEDGTNCKSMNWIMFCAWVLGALNCVLVLIILGLILKITHQSKLRKANNVQSPAQESQDSVGITYSALSFPEKNRRGRPKQKNPEANVVYAATR